MASRFTFTRFREFIGLLFQQKTGRTEMNLNLEPHGRITVGIELGDVEIQDRFYPLCGMTVETAVLSDKGWTVTLPDTYHQTTTIKGPKVPYDA